MGETSALNGSSAALNRMVALADRMADSSAPVLIQGETGTGKRTIARRIHDRSPRRRGPFVEVNCAALLEEVLAAQLFGYEKEADRKEGRFELADGGTLFLDEVADLARVTQPKILRVRQDGEFERVGGTKTLRVDVRIVTATCHDLAENRSRERLSPGSVLPPRGHQGHHPSRFASDGRPAPTTTDHRRGKGDYRRGAKVLPSHYRLCPPHQGR